MRLFWPSHASSSSVPTEEALKDALKDARSAERAAAQERQKAIAAIQADGTGRRGSGGRDDLKKKITVLE